MKKLKRLICYMFGHKYKLKSEVTKEVFEITCSRCNKEKTVYMVFNE